ncbi:MAG: 6-carboxytetrahydropterin synthase [Fimbriimonadaceae bacterium]|nr:6-carboxytetrahydropterin synthase [Fimbriimonadaceae bacterium]
MMSEVTLTRKVSFSAGHRYWDADLSEQENRVRFGNWASPYNHGHNYVLWVSTRGTTDPENGMVVNIKWIDDTLQERVVQRFDQKSINDEVEAFTNVSPTLENLLMYFYESLRDLPGAVELTHLRLDETPLLYGEWTPEMLTLTRTFEFAASHRLHAHTLSAAENERLFGKCNRPHGHGHNYVLEVTVSGQPDATTGMICPLDELDQVIEERVIERYDHRNLDLDLPELQGKCTTSEVVAQAIYDQLEGHLPARLERVRLYETARSAFTVERPR